MREAAKNFIAQNLKCMFVVGQRIVNYHLRFTAEEKKKQEDSSKTPMNLFYNTNEVNFLQDVFTATWNMSPEEEVHAMDDVMTFGM